MSTSPISAMSHARNDSDSAKLATGKLPAWMPRAARSSAWKAAPAASDAAAHPVHRTRAVARSAMKLADDAA